MSPMALRRHVQMMPRRFDVSWRKPDSNCKLLLPGADQLNYGATIQDRSGNGNNGTITGATWTKMPSGLWGLSFDGDDFVNCGNNASLQITNNLSFLAWIKTPAIFTTGAGAFATLELIASKWHPTGNQRSWYIGLLNKELGGLVDNVFVSFGDPADGTFEYLGYYDANLVANTCYQVGLTFASGALVVYINGGAVAIVNLISVPPATLFNSSANLLLGADTAGTANRWKGQIYLGRVIGTTVLSAANIANKRNQERWIFNV